MLSEPISLTGENKVQNKLFPGIVAVCTTFVIVFKAYIQSFFTGVTTIGATAITDTLKLKS